MKIFDEHKLAGINRESLLSSRKRSHLNIHDCHTDKVQRLFIHLVRGSYVEPHFHTLSHQWELFVVISGTIEIVFYTPEGTITKRLYVGDNQSCRVVEVEPNEIHSVECVSHSALMLEVKEGPYDPKTSKRIAVF